MVPDQGPGVAGVASYWCWVVVLVLVVRSWHTCHAPVLLTQLVAQALVVVSQLHVLVQSGSSS